MEGVSPEQIVPGAWRMDRKDLAPLESETTEILCGGSESKGELQGISVSLDKI